MYKNCFVFGLFLNILLYCCLRLQSYEKISRLQNVKEQMYVKPLSKVTFRSELI